MSGLLRHVGRELTDHVPYSIFSAAFGLIVVGLFSAVSQSTASTSFQEATDSLFHIFHPVHLLFSAAATMAMFWRHEHRLLKALVVSFLGAVVICGISDAIIPYIGGYLLGIQMELHICILNHPGLVLPFVLVGLFTGLVAARALEKSTVFSHTSHVFISSMASILYLISHGLTNWMSAIGGVFILVVLAVIIPCCISDIVFPLLVVEPEKDLSGDRAFRLRDALSSTSHRD